MYNYNNYTQAVVLLYFESLCDSHCVVLAERVTVLYTAIVPLCGKQ